MPTGIHEMTEEHKRHIGEALAGRKASQESIEHNRKAHLGIRPSEETRRKLSLARLGNQNMLGKHHSEATKRRIGLNGFHYGMLGKHHSKETKRKMSEIRKGEKNGMYGKHHSKETRKKLTLMGYERWKNSEYRKRVLGYKGMSGVEKTVLAIINRNKLPYRFVGNGDFLIERKCPDFVNTNGEKVAVEVFCKTHKDHFSKGGFEGWKKDRLKTFGKYGWQIVFIEGSELNEQIVLSVLKGGDSHY